MEHIKKKKKLFFLIHGYTGGRTDFNGLPDHIVKYTSASVHSVLLPGHETNISDLDCLKHDDFLKTAEDDLKEYIGVNDVDIIIGGVSFGAQLALELAAKYSVSGVFDICIPYRLKFPFNIWGLGILGIFKKYWGKRFSEYELILRKNAVYYDKMHRNGLKLVKVANKILDGELNKITCPMLTVHSKHDVIGSYHSAEDIYKKVSSSIKKSIILEDKHHNVFYSPSRQYVYGEIEKFFI